MERLAALAALAVRHAGAYTDLLLSDLDAGRQALRRRMIAAAVLAGSGLLATALACVWIIALAWDTRARGWIIAGLLIFFVAVAALALWRLNGLRSGEPPLLAQTAHEWAQDRKLLEELLARQRGEGP